VNELQDYHEEHRFSSDEKMEWWGYGEWVEEPDLVKFKYKDIECMVTRVAMEVPYAKDFHMFGGFLNGYVALTADHSFYQKKYEDILVDCHGGLTFGETYDNHYWIGFDCSHSFDYVPSTENMKKMAPCMESVRNWERKAKEMFGINSAFVSIKQYRNIEFCISECKSIIDQLLDITVQANLISSSNQDAKE
jgi:hypothetical protein